MATKKSDAIPANKVSANPFVHFVRGNKNLFQTNPLTAILAALVATVAAFGTSLLFIILITSNFDSFDHSDFNFIRFIVRVLLVWAITTLITGFFYEVVQRAVLTGTRRQKVSFGSLLPFVIQRYKLAVLIALILGGAFVAAVLIVSLAGAIAPALAILLAIAGLIAFIVLLFRMVYVFLVVIDDEQPESAPAVFKRSAALWRNSSGAVVCYYLTLIVIAIIVSALSPANSQTSLDTSNFSGPVNSQPVIGYGSLLIGSLIEGVLILIISAPISEIYNQAKKLADRK
ncbi:MAG TPA: hypothetical protein VHB51_01565 [Candidatus Saccharimonadales bacterium]|nr:hypothetical protein [Candidatus Saccharimonadales bacterium]